MKPKPFDTENITRQIVRKIAELEEFKESVLLTNPEQAAVFPCCVVLPPLQRPRYRGAAWDMSLTIEAWGDTQYSTMQLFDKIKLKLLELNLQLTNNTPLHRDVITDKWRYGGYFECRYDAIHNAFIQNR